MSRRQNKYKKYFLKPYFLIIFLLSFLSIFGIFFYISGANSTAKVVTVEPLTDTEELDKNHPGYNFLLDVRTNNFNLQASANALNFVSMYLTSGGDIYSVYDFINLYPELNFLKGAEKSHQGVFEKIKNRRVPYTYSDEGLTAFLAYLEALTLYGYSDITITGPLVYQYSKKAFYMKMILNDKLRGDSLDYPVYTQEEINKSIERALFFTKKADGNIADILNEEVQYKKIATRQAFESLIQFAYGVRYLEALDSKFDVRNDADDIFSFAKTYANKGKVPEVYLSVYFLDAASLLLLDKFSVSSQIKEDLKIFFTNEKKIKNFEPVITILNSRYKRTTTRYLHLDMYGYENVLQLSEVVPEFRSWLMSNGWVEKDFK